MGFKVKMIAEWYLDGKPAQEFVDEFNFTPAEIHAAMAYYYNNQEEIDARIAEDKRTVEEVRLANPSIIPQHLRGRDPRGDGLLLRQQVRNRRADC
ncbi:hypothetical protein AYO38_00930 [bacterium SCGC AG-212-C10]|nr:hypothetical protein AYO38_00930 [bacterium SCGC AG-212-C10]